MTMKQIGSVITTTPKAVSSYELNQLTERGAETQLSLEMKTKAVARLKEIADPNTVDRNLLSSLESITTYPVIEESRTRFPKDKDVEITITGYRLRIDDMETADRCLEVIEMSLTPLPSKEIEDQLKRLSALVVKPAGENSADVSFRIRMMAEQLSVYPADIVLMAVEKVTKTTTFWPSFAEFYKHIGWKLDKRNRLKDSVVNKKVALVLQSQYNNK